MESQCRACLTFSTEYMELENSLNGEKSYLECFIECTQLQADVDDDLPQILCRMCSTALLEAYNFIKTSHKSDAILRNSIHNKLHIENNNFAEKEIDNMQIVVLEDLSVKTNEENLEEELQDDCSDIDIKKNYSEDDADYLLEPSISDSQWACLECRRLLDGCVSYEGHMNFHRNLRPYKCLECQTKKYRCQKALDRHINLRHNKSVIIHQEDIPNEQHESKNNTGFIVLSTCNYCSKVFESSNALDLHLLVYHNPTSNSICALCSKNVKDHFDLNDHLCMEHPLEYSTLFKNLEELSTNDEEYNEDFKTEEDATESEDYTKNIELNNSVLLEICKFCNKKLLQRNMKKHLELHTVEEQQFLCAFCPRHFKNQKTLKQHEKTHCETSEDIVYICTDCDRSYQTATLLEQHRRNSHKEREYNCKICGNAFKLNNQLKNHMKLHLEKNIQCPFCDKKYARRFDLNVHLRSHTGEMPYECHLCDKKFAIKVRLTYHLQKHYGIKHYCKECGAEFNSRHKLKAHSFKHTGMPYRCKLCDDHGFPNRDVFKRHLLRVHHATISEEALLEMFQRNTGKSTRIREVNVLSE